MRIRSPKVVRRFAGAAQATANVVHWIDVPPRVADFIYAKGFATLDAFAEVVDKHIRSKIPPSMKLDRGFSREVLHEVERALETPGSGFSFAGRPDRIIAAHMAEVLDLENGQVPYFLRHKTKDSEDTKREIHANVVKALIRRQELVHILNWGQLIERDHDANVPHLTNHLEAAYYWRSKRHRILVPHKELGAIHAVLNQDMPGRCKFEAIVPVDVWRAAHIAKMHHDPFSGIMGAYILTPR